MIGQQDHVAAALAQGWQINGKNIQAIKQIRAETVGYNILLQIAVRGGDDAYIDIDNPRRSQRLKTFFLQHTQELDLRGGGEFAYFIEKNRAAVGFFKTAAALL